MRKIILAFVPVLHKGYIDFFSKNKGDIFIFDQSLINSFVHLTRDLRIIKPSQTVSFLKILFPERSISLANDVSLKKIAKENFQFTLPQDEVSSDITNKYLKECTVKYTPIFLRWNKVITLSEHKIPKHRKITKAKFHREFLKIAEKESTKSSDWWRQIGSVAVKDGKIIFTSHNHHLPSDHHLSTFGDPRSNFDAGQHQEIFTSIHSEANIIAQAANKGISLKDATLYVTTFPCPNCARLISKAGIKRIYYSKGYSLLDAEKILNYFGVEIFLVM